MSRKQRHWTLLIFGSLAIAAGISVLYALAFFLIATANAHLQR